MKTTEQLFNKNIIVGNPNNFGRYSIIDGIRRSGKNIFPTYHRKSGLVEVYPPISKKEAQELEKQGMGLKQS